MHDFAFGSQRYSMHWGSLSFFVAASRFSSRPSGPVQRGARYRALANLGERSRARGTRFKVRDTLVRLSGETIESMDLRAKHGSSIG